MILMSAGIMSPAFTSTMSPRVRSPAEISTFEPFLLTWVLFAGFSWYKGGVLKPFFLISFKQKQKQQTLTQIGTYGGFFSLFGPCSSRASDTCLSVKPASMLVLNLLHSSSTVTLCASISISPIIVLPLVLLVLLGLFFASWGWG